MGVKICKSPACLSPREKMPQFSAYRFILAYGLIWVLLASGFVLVLLTFREALGGGVAGRQAMVERYPCSYQ